MRYICNVFVTDLQREEREGGNVKVTEQGRERNGERVLIKKVSSHSDFQKWAPCFVYPSVLQQVCIDRFR